jgi:hypothetical protein
MRRTVFIAAACAAAMALASCASFQHSWDQGNVENVAKLINDGQSARLAAMSATPFLVDGEIVPLKADVAGFWEGIIKAGYKVQGPALGEAAPVNTDTYKHFADTMEVKSFFAQYVKKDTRVLELRTANGRILLIIRDSWFSKTIHGFKGPF